MNALVQGLNAQESPLALTQFEIINAFGNSFVLGLVLMLITVWASYRIAQSKAAPSEKEKKMTPQDVIFTSMNVLFLCFGMTAVMLLVNNNLARAFAIGAAIALIRFRVKVDNKAMSMALLYGVLAGMACGVSQFVIAYSVTVAFGFLMVVSLTLASAVGKRTSGKPCWISVRPKLTFTLWGILPSAASSPGAAVYEKADLGCCASWGLAAIPAGHRSMRE